MYTWIYMCMSMRRCVCKCIYVYMYLFMCILVYMYICHYVHAYVYVFGYAYVMATCRPCGRFCRTGCNEISTRRKACRIKSLCCSQKLLNSPQVRLISLSRHGLLTILAEFTESFPQFCAGSLQTWALDARTTLLAAY